LIGFDVEIIANANGLVRVIGDSRTFSHQFLMGSIGKNLKRNGERELNASERNLF
jgi:hypothetical protein